MLDCGWDIHFDTALLEPLRSVVKRVDLVVISHPDLEHLGVGKNLILHFAALPYYCTVVGRDLPHLQQKSVPTTSSENRYFCWNIALTQI